MSPKAAGDKVVLQQRMEDKKTWSVSGTAKIKANGKFLLKDEPSTAGTRFYRVLKPAEGKVKKGVSKELELVVYGWEKLGYRQPGPATNVAVSTATIATETFPASLVTTTVGPPGSIEYTLGKKCLKLRSTYALTDDTVTGGTGTVALKVDGTVAFAAGLAVGDVLEDVETDVSGAFRISYELAASATPARPSSQPVRPRCSARSSQSRSPLPVRERRSRAAPPDRAARSPSTQTGSGLLAPGGSPNRRPYARPVVLLLVAGTDFDQEIKQLQATMSTIGQVLDLDKMRTEIADLGEQVAEPDLWDDQDNATRVTGRLSALQGELDKFTGLDSRIEDLALMVEMATEEGDSATLEDSERELERIKKSVESLEIRTLLNGEYDAREALISIRSGAGGVDAADFAETLMRMYLRWAEQHKYPVEVFETSYAEEAGLKSATFAVHAPYAYGTLSVEAGTHRLVRISPFDNQGRRQTSFAAVEVVPVLETTDEIDIPDEDIRTDVYRSGGPGGQSVNTTDSAVRLTHIPTGTVVSCQNEKSQLQNKASAMVVLKAKLLALKKAEEKAHLDGMRGDVQASWGDQMRNYVLNPYQIVKDLRTGFESGNPSSVFDGDLDGFLEAGIRWRRAGEKADA